MSTLSSLPGSQKNDRLVSAISSTAYSPGRNRPGRRWALAVCVQAAVLMLSGIATPSAQAAAVNWAPDADGLWNVPANWNPASPTAADDVTINVAGVRTITHNSGTDTIRTLTNAETVLILGGSTLNISLGGTNTGFLTAGGASAGTLNLNGGTLTNTGGVITAANGGTVGLSGVTVTGGTLQSSGSGVFRANSSGNNVLNNVTLTGVLDVASGSSSNRRERIVNGLTLNSGSINIANGGILSLDSTLGANQTIGGSGGTINLNDAGARLAIEGNGNTTLGSGLTVRGQGNVGQALFAGGTNNLTNNGLISADVSGGTLNITPPAGSGSLTNNGVLEAVGGGTLLLSTNVTANTGSQIAAGAGSSVVQNGVTISGVINTSGGGLFTASNSGNNILDGVTLNGVLDVASGASSNRRERVINGLTLNGAVNIANGGILSLDSNSTPGGAQTINGTGVINLNDAAARLTMEGNGSTTLGAGLTVRGQGNIGGPAIIAGGNNTLINNGLISADVSGGTLNIVPPANGGSLTNNGTLRASNGGTLTVSSALTNLSGTTLTGGTYEVIAGAGTANMRLPNANIVTNAATILLDGANSNLLNNNTSGNALLNLATNATTTTPGSFTIQNGRNFTTAGAFTNNVLGTVTVGNASTFNSTGAFTNNGILAMRGGTFNAPSLSSSGQVNGNGTITPNIANSGLVLSNGGTLTAVNGITGSGGFDTVVSNPGSTLAIGAASTASLLVNNGNLALGANNITVGGVYDNANFGTGNSFDRRANVTGTGLILASGATPGAAQTLAGNIVGGGPTSGNATMNFGNIRVGSSSTLNYQIGNANSGGPSLTGAIQTAVNGGNISDVRLSGSGVTASNWGPIADGANTGNLGVTFTATSAGALTGQQVHIRNNFDNTNAQNLVITGAAFNLASGNTTPSPVVFGNAHVGDIRTQVLTISNTAPTGAFTEGLNASFGATTGNVSNNGGSVSLLAGGASNNTNLAVTLDTSAAGARSGSATLNYVSDGAGTSGLGTTSVGSQTINVSGNVYRLALANDIGDINFGSVLVGSTQTRTVSISNLAAADGFSEALNAAFGTIGGTNPGQFSVAGLINQLAAGANDNASMVVTLNTGSAGTYSANVQILLNSDGTGTSGLGITALPTQVINLDGIVTGTVGNLAQAGPHSPEPVNFGNVRQGSTQNQVLSIQNTASGPAEGLNASISTNSPGVVTAGGAFMNLAPGATNNTDLVVGLNTSVAGARAGTATIALESDGTFNSGTTTPLPSQTVNVAGNVYRLANPTLNTTSVNLAARVGDASPTAGVSVTNSSPDSFTEGLNVTRGSTAGGFTSSGSVSNLAAGGTNGGAIQVALNTSTAGSFSGTQALNYVSTGAGTTGAADVSVGSAFVNLAGKVYQQAVAQVNTTLVNFGIVHRGDTVAPVAVSVTNSAPVAGLNDVLRGSLGGASGPFSASGNLGAGVAAGATDSSSLSVGLDTSATGVFNGTATASLVSHNDDMADLIIGGIPVTLSAQVNDYANADLRKTGGDGSLSRSALNIVLDFGTLVQGSGTRTASLDVFNNVAGPADLLDGLFSLLDTDDFLFSGVNPFSNLAAGDSQGGLSVAFDALTLGSFSDTILLASLVGHNASGYSGSLPDVTFRILASVIADDGDVGTVPEPESLLLMAIGMASLIIARRRRVTLH